MGTEALLALKASYTGFTFGQLILDILVDEIVTFDTKIDALDTKIDALEARVGALEG